MPVDADDLVVGFFATFIANFILVIDTPLKKLPAYVALGYLA